MPDLKDQIRTYYEATTEPVDVDAFTVDPGTVLVGPFPDVAQRRGIVQTDPQPSPVIKPRWWTGARVAVASFGLIILIGVFGFMAARGDGPSEDDASSTVPTSIEVALNFAGDSCAYDGPTEITRGSIVALTFTNNSDAIANAGLWGVPDGMTAADLPQTNDLASQPGFTVLAHVAEIEPGESSTRERVVGVPGRHMWNCFVMPQDATAATAADNHRHFFEVVAP